MSDNLRADALRRQAILRQRMAQGHSDAREPIRTFGDGGRVYRANDGALNYSSPGYSTNNPEVVKRIMAGQPVPEAMQAADAPSTGGRVGAVARSGLQGLTFGAGDEAVAAGTSLLPGRSYETELERERQRLEQGRSEFPVSSLAGEIGGAAATGIALGVGPVAAQRGLTARAGAGAGIGAVEGGLYGFNSGQGGFENRVGQARTGASIGAVAGGAAPYIVRALQAGSSAVVNPVAGAFNLGNQSRAVRSVARALQSSGRSTDDVSAALRQAADDGQPMMVADAMGVEGQRALAGVARQPGPARVIASEALEQRQRDHADRMARAIRDGFGGADTAAMERARLVASRADDAGVDYAAATATARPVDVSGAVGEIDDLLRRDPILGETSLSEGALGRRLQRFRDRLANEGEQAIDFGTVRQIRTDLRDYFDRNPQARAQFGSVYDRLTTALSDASPDFAAANARYRSASGVIDAVDQGGQSVSPGVRGTDVVDRFSRLPEEAQAGFRTGVGDELLTRIERARPGADTASPMQSTQMRQIADDLADNPDQFRRRVDREALMSETRQRALGGSQTADNAADQAAVNADDVSVLASLLQGNAGNAASQVARRFVSHASGNNERTREAIARILTSTDAAPLERAVQSIGNASARQRLIEALARRAGQTAGYTAYLQ